MSSGSSGCVSGSEGSVFWSIFPLFQLASGVPLSREVFISQMRKALQPSGEDSTQYQVTASEIGLQQQWCERSAYLLYMTMSCDRLAGFSRPLSRVACLCSQNGYVNCLELHRALSIELM